MTSEVSCVLLFNIPHDNKSHSFIVEKTVTPSDMKPVESSESWAVFEPEHAPKAPKEKSATPTNVKPSSKEHPQLEKESPYSSDGKNDYKQREKEYHRRWPKPHTSSSSRDVSPWDEDAPQPSGDYRRKPRPWDEDVSQLSGDYRRRPRPHHHELPPPHHHPTDRYARPPGPRRRINSCDEEYDEEYERRPPLPSRGRITKGAMQRSKEILNSENPNWRYPSEHWSDEDEAERMERARPFDRNTYERSTYGPPYDKRDPYDRRDFKGYDKRSKYYRSSRNDYEYDPDEMPPPVRGKPPRKEFDDYEGNFERGPRDSRSAREYFYDRDRKSFDSNESYDSARGHRMGSGEISGSYEGGRGDYRDRYMPSNRSLRRNQRARAGPEEDDSDEEVPVRRPSGDTGSLQRPTTAGPRSKHIQLDDDVWGGGPGGKHWKRPSSATAGERMSGSGGLSGSDGEKDKRFQRQRKLKPVKGKEVELRSNYATIRYSQGSRKEFYEFEDDGKEFVDESLPRNVSPRLQDPETSAYYARRKQTANVRNSTTPRSETKGFSEYSKPRYPDEEEYEARRIQPRVQGFKKSTSRDLYVDDTKEYYGSVKQHSSGFEDEEAPPKRQSNTKRMEFNSEEQPQPTTQPQDNNKFFDGFESDFNSSPKQQEQAKSEQPQNFSFETEFSPSTSAAKNGSNQQKLRFNENVSVSKFDANSSAQQMFEDDFLEWTPEAPATGSNIQSSLKKAPGSNLKANSAFNRHENIKKSDSVNIFARKSDEDPFENDDFFNDESKEEVGNNGRSDQDPFHWSNKNNFANFDENKNI